MKSLIALLILALCPVAQAREATFAWDANPEPDVVGYRLYLYSISTDSWMRIADVADNPATPANDPPTQATVADFPNVVSRIHATAYNRAGLESLPSEELVVEPEAPGAPGGLRRKVVSLQTSSDLGATWQTVADYYLPTGERMFARLEFREEDVAAQ